MYLFIITYLHTRCQILRIFPRGISVAEAHTFGRILRLLVKVASRCGPKALLSPMVARWISDVFFFQDFLGKIGINMGISYDDEGETPWNIIYQYGDC